MCIAVAGSSFGGLLHPIMLNCLFHGSSSPHASFVLGVRASGGLILGVQIIAILLLRTKYPDKVTNQIDSNTTLNGTPGDIGRENKGDPKTAKEISNSNFDTIKRFASDLPYVCFVFG